MLGDIMDKGWSEVAFVDRLFDRQGEYVGAVSADFARRQERLFLVHLVEETFCCLNIAVGCKQEIHGIAVLVYGPVKEFPLPPHLDVSFIHPNRPAVGFAKPPQSFLDERSIGQAPSVDCAMVDFKAALKEYLFQISIAKRVTQIPRHRLNDQPRLKLETFEVIFRFAFQLFGNGIKNHTVLLQLVGAPFH